MTYKAGVKVLKDFDDVSIIYRILLTTYISSVQLWNDVPCSRIFGRVFSQDSKS